MSDLISSLSSKASLNRKGDAFIDKWMAENCRLIECDGEMQQAVPDFINFKEQFRGIPGRERLESEGVLSSFMLFFGWFIEGVECHTRTHTHTDTRT